MGAMRQASGLVAAVLVALVGFVFAWNGTALVALPLLIVGLGAAAWQGRLLILARRDPYDLTRLWDTPAADADPVEEPPLVEEGDLPMCHNCGHAVRGAFARCPDCGNPLR